MDIRRGTTLSDGRSRRTSLLCLLYFCQGFPWGFTPTLTDFYLVAGLLPLIALVLLVGLDPDGVVARKLADQRRAVLALPGAT